MGIFGKLFGGKPEAAAVAPIDDQALIDDVAHGKPIDLRGALDERDEDAAFALLLQLLPLSTGTTRVDVIDHLAEFELSDGQQRDLIAAACEWVPGPQWTAASIAMACDLTAMCGGFDADVDADMTLLDAIGQQLSALCEVTLTTGPSGTALDVEQAPEHLTAWAAALARCGAKAGDLLGLAMARELCRRGEDDDELDAHGFDEPRLAGFDAAIAHVLASGPRGGDTTWDAHLGAAVTGGTIDEAGMALQAAQLTQTSLREALNARILARPEEQESWDLAAVGGYDAALIQALAPVAVRTLQFRRGAQDELCSPSSQAGCLKCGGAEPAPDDEMMIPKSLRDRLLPLIAALQTAPGEHGDLLQECLAAPDPNLRVYALAALVRWDEDVVPDPLHAQVEELTEDSMPAVREQALLVVETWDAAAA